MKMTTSNELTYKRVLSIAGSDPSGGAGIQADIKTISACGCFASAAITAVVDENTVGVKGVFPIPPEFVACQIRSVLDDIGTDSIKIGMLHSSELILQVKETLSLYPDIRNIVLDPVMVATSGDHLLETSAVDSLKEYLIPISKVITPNIPEAEILLQEKITGIKDLPEAVRALSKLFPGVSVFLKGGHLSDDQIIDFFYNAETGEMQSLGSERIITRNTHGTGCTLSSALASFLAKGFSLDTIPLMAKRYINSAIASGARYVIGHGHGPVDHFFNQRDKR